MMDSANIILDVQHLTVTWQTADGIIQPVNDVSFCVRRGETVGLVGESGCGKTMTALALLQLIPTPGRISGQINFWPLDHSIRQGLGTSIDIASLSAKSTLMRAIRGQQIAMIFQEPMTAFTPVYTIGAQIDELLRPRQTKAQARRAEIIERLAQVGIRRPAECIDLYPHEMSGGMLQRAMIAMMIANQPCLLIADEPTTALDMTVQAEILELLRRLQAETSMAILLVSHDLGVIADMADEVIVMYTGQVVEAGPAHRIFYDPQHPYTKGLLHSALQLAKEQQARLAVIPGSVPGLTKLPSGCHFAPRCPLAMDICLQPPILEQTAERHWVRCWATGAASGDKHDQ